MISARELREITETSDKQVDMILESIGKKLVEAAQAGERHYACYRETEWHAERVGVDVRTTPIQTRLIEKLKQLGYQARVEKHGDQYVPRAYDEDTQDFHENHVLVIRW